MKIKEAFDKAFIILSSTIGIENKREIYSDIYFLLSYILNTSISNIKLNIDKNMSSNELETFFKNISRRVKHEPVQYIIGRTEFFSINFIVKQGVLIPRFDSEILVQEVLKRYKNKENIQFLDLCCGTGCLGISILKNLDKSTCTFVDNSNKAILNTSLNLKEHNLLDRSNIIKSNMFNKLNKSNFDFIVSNPPYIKSSILNNLALKISMYEPIKAFDGGSDGLDFYKIISDNYKNYLKENAMLFLELDSANVKQISKLFSEKQFEIVNDLGGKNRLIIVKNNKI